jgi:hypothetical protein
MLGDELLGSASSNDAMDPKWRIGRHACVFLSCRLAVQWKTGPSSGEHVKRRASHLWSALGTGSARANMNIRPVDLPNGEATARFRTASYNSQIGVPKLV